MKNIVYFYNGNSNKVHNISSSKENICYHWKDLEDGYCNYFKSRHFPYESIKRTSRIESKVIVSKNIGRYLPYASNSKMYDKVALINHSLYREDILNENIKKSLVDAYKSTTIFEDRGFIHSIFENQLDIPENLGSRSNKSISMFFTYDLSIIENEEATGFCPDRGRKYDIDYISQYVASLVNTMFSYYKFKEAFLSSFNKLFISNECNFNYKLLKSIKKIEKEVYDYNSKKRIVSYIEIIETESGYNIIVNANNGEFISEYNYTPDTSYDNYDLETENDDLGRLFRFKIGE